MRLYGSTITSLRSLLGSTGVVDVAPTHTAAYRAHATRGIAPLADVYMPARPTGASVVLVHGGGFAIGSRRMKPMRYLAAKLTASGVAVCSVDYRMIFRGGRLAEAVDDVCDGFAFWSARALQLGLDGDAISLVGLSAGATISVLAATRVERLASLTCCFGLYELDHLRGAAALLPRLLYRTSDRAAWIAPRFAPQPTVPTLLLHGTEDGLVPVEQARRLATHRESLGLPTRLVIYEGAPHGFFNVPVPAAEAAVQEIVGHVVR